MVDLTSRASGTFGEVLDMLSFSLSGQTYGINVFKIMEIVKLGENDRFSSLPHSHPNVRGIIKVRDMVVPVIDTKKAINKNSEFSSPEYLLIAEVSGYVRGLMVDSVSNIEHVAWTDVAPPPKSIGQNGYVSSIAKIGERMIPLLDIEKILNEVDGDIDVGLSIGNVGCGRSVLVVDDSLVSYKQVAKCAESLGFTPFRCSDGVSGYEHLMALIESGVDVIKHYPLVIIDIEMPRMDGYQLTAKIRETAFLKGLKIMINSSLSSAISKDTAYRAGADLFLSKFNPEEIQKTLIDAVKGEAAKKNAA